MSREPESIRGVAPQILVVEDESSLAITLEDRLCAEGYAVEVCGSGEAALKHLESNRVDLVILDIMLPGIDGFEVCRTMRSRGIEIPVLMLTARSQVFDRVVGLKLGADDYLSKPFEMAELLARVEALLRRSGRGATAVQQYRFGDVSVDLRRAVVTQGGREVPMSSLELRLLEHFIEHRGELLSREQLLDEVWGYESMPSTRTVDVHVAGLRQKLEANPSHPRYFITVHRRGYRFDG